jgi:putative acetyltransferase
VAGHDYTAEQIEAWAPRDLDAALWENKMREINPFVAELNGELVGYADVQTNGYIDHVFVSGKHPRRGVGLLLMTRILEQAISRGVSLLTSHVSRTAQPFFPTIWVYNCRTALSGSRRRCYSERANVPSPEMRV